MEALTSRKGYKHVTSTQFRKMMCTVVGDGSFYGNTDASVKTSITSATQASISAGTIVHHGHVVLFDGTDKVTIEPASIGYKRRDCICLKHTINSNDTESDELVVIKGTQTTGTPSKPSVPTGNMNNGSTNDYLELATIAWSGSSATMYETRNGNIVKMNTLSGITGSVDDALEDIDADAIIRSIQTAQNRADSAYTLASTANSTANTAKSTAETAKSWAEENGQLIGQIHNYGFEELIVSATIGTSDTTVSVPDANWSDGYWIFMGCDSVNVSVIKMQTGRTSTIGSFGYARGCRRVVLKASSSTTANVRWMHVYDEGFSKGN